MAKNNTEDDPILLTVEAIGDLFQTVGLKAASGRIWGYLYLQSAPKSAVHLQKALTMSSGAISMGLNELLEVGIVHRGAHSQDRCFYYRAETEMWPLVRRIFKERAKAQIEQPIAKIKRALQQMEQSIDVEDEESAPPQLIQIRHLLDLGDFALVLLDAFMDRTRVELKAAHKWLSVSGKLGGEPLSRLRRRLNQKG